MKPNSNILLLIILISFGVAYLVWGKWILAYRKELKLSKKQTIIRYPHFSRAKFFSQLGMYFSTSPLLSFLFQFHKGRFSFFIQHQKIQFENLPKAFQGFKIVHISDIHLGCFASNFNKLAGVIELINKEKADIICFTGDMVNNFYEETIGWDKVFCKLQANYGKYSILGNHDYGDYTTWKIPGDKQNNFNGIVQAHEKFGFTLLQNESISIEIKGDKIRLGGVGNWGHGTLPKYTDLSKTFTETELFKILLSHNPDHWEAEVVKKTSINLTLSGHSHGMQFGIKKWGSSWSPAKYIFKYWDGLYRQNKQFLYVNRGLGYLGLPARIGMPPEITVIELY